MKEVSRVLRVDWIPSPTVSCTCFVLVLQYLLRVQRNKESVQISLTLQSYPLYYLL